MAEPEAAPALDERPDELALWPLVAPGFWGQTALQAERTPFSSRWTASGVSRWESTAPEPGDHSGLA